MMPSVGFLCFCVGASLLASVLVMFYKLVPVAEECV